MKQIIKALVFLPIVALSSCSFLGKQVDEEFVNKYEEKIVDMDDLEYVTLKLNVSATEGKEKTQVKGKYLLKKDKDDNKYFFVDGAHGEEKEYIEIYQVKNETYEEVTWIKYLEDGKENTVAYAKKDNDNYSKQTNDYTMNAGLVPALMYAVASKPSQAAKELLDEDGTESTITYYSTGEKNLTLKKVIKEASNSSSKEPVASSGEEEKDEENPISGNVIITYNNYLLSSFNATTTSNLGNKQKIDGAASYGKLTVSLPSGWEKVLAK